MIVSVSQGALTEKAATKPTRSMVGRTKRCDTRKFLKEKVGSRLTSRDATARMVNPTTTGSRTTADSS